MATKQQTLLDELRNLMALRDAGEISAEEVEIRTAQVLQGQTEAAAASGRSNRVVTAATSATPTPIRRPIAVAEPAALVAPAAPGAPVASAAPGVPVASAAPAATEQATTRWGRRRNRGTSETGGDDASRAAVANGNDGQQSSGDKVAATPASPAPVAPVKAAPESAGVEKGPIGPTMGTTPSIGGETAAKAAAEAVGVRITDILKTALEAGQEARQTMEADAAKTLEQAESKAADLVRLAEHRAEQLRIQSERVLREAEAIKATAIDNARVEAARIVEESRRQSETLQNYIDGLTEFKAKALNELRRLEEHMTSASTAPQSTEGPTAQAETVTPRPVAEVEMNGRTAPPTSGA